jgi:hypothetical protein
MVGDDVPGAFGIRLGLATLATSIVWIAVTFATAPEPMERLQWFYRKIRPSGSGWGPVARACGLEPVPGEIAGNLLNTALGIVFVYGALFTSGGWLLHETDHLWVTAAACFGSGAWLTMRLVQGKG